MVAVGSREGERGLEWLSLATSKRGLSAARVHNGRLLVNANEVGDLFAPQASAVSLEVLQPAEVRTQRVA